MGSDRHSQVSSVAICFRGYDKPRLMGVAIAIDPFQTHTIHVWYIYQHVPYIPI